ncbi:MAG: hypothetical protein MPK62_12740, partial [Alphaproteobacteria bacterium]|nr:hypothetical protein [Alphaproteobacteria bacterium]
MPNRDRAPRFGARDRDRATRGGLFKRPRSHRQVVELAGRDKVLYTAHLKIHKEFYLTENS